MLGSAHIQVGAIDYSIMAIYVLFVLGIGWVLKRSMKTSSDFLTSGKSIPAWITGLAFISTNLGALEVIGNGRQRREIRNCHLSLLLDRRDPRYGVSWRVHDAFLLRIKGALRAEYLKLRFNEKTRGFNAISFAVMTIFASGISMFAMAKLMQILLGWDFNFSLIMSAITFLFTHSSAV